MATRQRTRRANYQSYGNVAYVPSYDGSAVRVPERQEELQRTPRTRTRERSRTKALTRTKVQVREAGAVAPFAVIGFLAVGVLAAALLWSFAQLTVLSDQVIGLRNQVSALQTENAALTAQYERVFDINCIQEAVGNRMTRPTADQVVYIDLSKPDTVILYHEIESSEGFGGFLASGKEILSRAIEYFR